MTRALLAAWLLAVQAVAAPVAVQVPSLEVAGPAVIVQPGQWFRIDSRVSAPAVVLLHGCGGPYAKPGELSERLRDYAALLNAAGVHVLVTDSFTPRGETELCTQHYNRRRVTPALRRLDALGALRWLAAQPGVDARRLGLIGWSNGGSTVLAAINAADAQVRRAEIKPAFAVAYYPGCAAELRHEWRPVAPTLLLLGAADDWTPPEPCRELAARSEPRPQIEVYPGAYHGFDGTAPVRHRRDVPNGVRPGQGVHVGGDAAARAASRERLLRFVRQVAAPD